MKPSEVEVKATQMQIEQRCDTWLQHMRIWLKDHWPSETHQYAEKVLRDFARKTLHEQGYIDGMQLAYADVTDKQYIARLHLPKLKLEHFKPSGWLKARHESAVLPTRKDESIEMIAYDPDDIRLGRDEAALKTIIENYLAQTQRNEKGLGDYNLTKFIQEASRLFNHDVIDYIEGSDEKRAEIERHEKSHHKFLH